RWSIRPHQPPAHPSPSSNRVSVPHQPTLACLRLELSRRLGRSPAAKQPVTGLFDEVVSAHIAVTLPQLVPAFRATLPTKRSGHALDNLAEHRCVLTNNTRMVLVTSPNRFKRSVPSRLMSAMTPAQSLPVILAPLLSNSQVPVSRVTNGSTTS